MKKDVFIQLSELEFNIYSNALVRIGGFLSDKVLMAEINSKVSRFIQIPIESFDGALTPFDTVIFDREEQRFSRIEYIKMVSKNKSESFEIEIPKSTANYSEY